MSEIAEDIRYDTGENIPEQDQPFGPVSGPFIKDFKDKYNMMFGSTYYCTVGRYIPVREYPSYDKLHAAVRDLLATKEQTLPTELQYKFFNYYGHWPRLNFTEEDGVVRIKSIVMAADTPELAQQAAMEMQVILNHIIASYNAHNMIVNL